MANDNYKISLGIGLDAADFNSIKDKINSLEENPIKIKLDINDADKKINNIKEQLKNLGSIDNNKSFLTIDTAKVESSLTELSKSIIEIKTSLGTIDNKSGMKSLLSSINQISIALEKASSQFENLNAALKSLSAKDFSFNFNLKTGNSNPVKAMTDYGREARNRTIPQLQEQAAYLQDVLGGYQEADRALQNYLVKLHKFNGVSIKNNLLDDMANTDSLSKQMDALNRYVNILKQIASMKGIDLSDFYSAFPTSANEIVDSTVKIQSGAKETEEALDKVGDKLKQVFGGGIDAESLSAQLNPIITDLREIKEAITNLSSGISIDGLTASFNKLSETIELLVKNCTNMKTAINDSVGGLGSSVGQSGSGLEKVENDLKQVTITADNTSDAIQSMRNAMSGMKFDSSSIDAVTKDLEEMNIIIKEVSSKTKGNNLDITVKGINELGDAITVIKRFNADTGNFDIIGIKISKSFDEGVQAAKRFKNEAETVRNIKLDIELGTFDNELSGVYNKFNKLSDASKELRDSVQAVENALQEMKNAASVTGDDAADIERLTKARENYAKALDRTNNLLQIQTRNENAAAASQKLADDIDVFQSKIDAWLTKNSAATKQFGAKMMNLRAQAENCDRVTLNHLEKEFKQVDNAADKAGLKVQSFGDKIKTKLKEYTAYFSIAEVFMYAEQAFRSMFEQVKLIDSAMTELKKVTNETDASYNKFLSNAATRAREIGTTIDGLVSSTADFARLGYGFKDAQGLAEVANIYTVVGDEIEGVEGATQSLISTMAAFKNEMNGLSDSDFALSIVDKFNEVSNNFSISSGGIGEALTRSASSLAAANNTLDESIALITAAM